MSIDVNYRGDGTAIYTTLDNDMVDQIARAFYGTHLGTTELVLNANPNLARRPFKLPAGVEIVLPPYKPPDTKPRIRLWD